MFHRLDYPHDCIKLPVLEFCEAVEDIGAFQHPLPELARQIA